METVEKNILDFIKNNAFCSSGVIAKEFDKQISLATIKRILNKLLSEQYITSIGKGRGTKYSISPSFELLFPIDLDEYYKDEIDDRKINEEFNINIFSLLENTNIFSTAELTHLSNLQRIYSNNISEISELEYNKELERLAIDLSWKSSQIEGNTYSLLETERLLKDKVTAAGRTMEEAIMLLNHKDAIDFLISNLDYLNPLSISKIEDIHSLLIKELAIDRNLRKRRVGISGTNYRPLDNEFQIREALESACNLVNNKSNIFEKAILILVLISYIQPFVDGNKRTARIVSNAILMQNKYCPISFRTVDSIDYKQAMLLFYELNNISAMKDIFINQFEFAVKNYF